MLGSLFLLPLAQAQYTGFIGHPESGLCLSASCATVNCLVQLQTCTEGNDLQQWNWPGSGNNLKSIGAGNLCLAPQSATGGAQLEVLACAILPKFKWDETDGPSESIILANEADNTLCLAVEATNPGSQAVLLSCDGGVGEQWVQGIPGGNIVPPEHPHGLSLGSIILIVLGALFFVYVVAGCIFQRKVKGVASMKESFPNHEFWVQLPKLVKEGALFSFRKIKGCVGRLRGKPVEDYETI